MATIAELEAKIERERLELVALRNKARALPDGPERDAIQAQRDAVRAQQKTTTRELEIATNQSPATGQFEGIDRTSGQYRYKNPVTGTSFLANTAPTTAQQQLSGITVPPEPAPALATEAQPETAPAQVQTPAIATPLVDTVSPSDVPANTGVFANPNFSPEAISGTPAPAPVDTPLLTPAESIARAQTTAPADVDTAVDGGNGSSYTPGGTGASSANSFAAGAGTGDGLTDQERAQRDAAIAEKTAKENAINQATRQSRYKQAGSTDWRVRLQLAPTSNYLYNAPVDNETGTGPGILAPLAVTNGVVFPYTPQINTTYRANYESYDLVHSNYRGVYYKNSRVDDVTIRAVFTAQDTTEADYLLAVIHFFRSVTKMFYGKDPQRGSPPPLVYLNGLGPNQFSGHPCVVTSFQYNLPDNVDYIRATSFNTYGTDLLNRRTPSKSSSIPGLGATGNRLVNAGLALFNKPRPSPDPVVGSVNNTQLANYVPTKMEIDITLIPVQTRSQVSKQFSLSNFANGNLIKGGYW
jgi:hypothetical protein